MGDAADHLTETMLDQKALHDAGLCNDFGCEWCRKAEQAVGDYPEPDGPDPTDH
jgi:hypothetical protein